MMNKNQHIIRKAVVDIKTDRDVRSTQMLSGSVSKIIQRLSQGALDELFCDIGHGKHLLIDKLEIDLGNIGVEEFETELIKKLNIQLLSLSPGKPDTPGPASERSVENRELDMLWFFLEHGRRPWYVPISLNSREFQKQISAAYQKVLRSNPGSVRRFLIANLSNPSVFDRIISLQGRNFTGLIVRLSPAIRVEAVQALYDFFVTEGVRSPQDMKVSLLKAAVLQGNNKHPGIMVTALFMQNISAFGSPKSAERFIKAAAKQAYGAFLDESFQGFISIMHLIIKKSPSVSDSMELMRKMTEEGIPPDLIKTYFKSVPAESDLTESIYNFFLNPDQKKTYAGWLKEKLNTERSQLTQASDKTDENWVNNAGIVIIWPFLERLFKTLELVYDGQFLDEKARERAVLILDYLSYGNKNTGLFEDRMILSKLLCGYAVEKSINSELVPGESEKSECQKLLKSVIDHWSVLKNSSPQSLQKSFFLRQGRLKMHTSEKRYSLKIERHSIDVLIDRIPWPLSIIRLPWMNNIIHVEW